MSIQLSEIVYALCVLFQLLLGIAGVWAVLVTLFMLIFHGIPSLIAGLRDRNGDTIYGLLGGGLIGIPLLGIWALAEYLL